MHTYRLSQEITPQINNLIQVLIIRVSSKYHHKYQFFSPFPLFIAANQANGTWYIIKINVGEIQEDTLSSDSIQLLEVSTFIGVWIPHLEQSLKVKRE